LPGKQKGFSIFVREAAGLIPNTWPTTYTRIYIHIVFAVEGRQKPHPGRPTNKMIELQKITSAAIVFGQQTKSFFATQQHARFICILLVGLKPDGLELRALCQDLALVRSVM